MRQQDDLTNQLMEVGFQQRARLIRLCTRMTGKSDVAEDLAQETLLEAWKHLHTLRTRSASRPGSPALPAICVYAGYGLKRVNAPTSTNNSVLGSTWRMIAKQPWSVSSILRSN